LGFYFSIKLKNFQYNAYIWQTLKNPSPNV